MGSNRLRDSLKELKRVSYVAAPMVAVMVLQYLMSVISVLMVGHIDDLSLSGVSIATSFSSVTGYSLLSGMAGALETLCGQAYGAEQYQKMGTYTYSAMFSLILLCFPVSIVWIFTDKLLMLAGQDHLISRVAQKYSVFLIPNLFAYAILQALTRYFQTQSLILPMLFSSFASLCLHVLFCWVLVFKAKLGIRGAAVSIGLAYWLNATLLGVYMKYSSKCQKTRSVLSKDIFQCIKEFFHLAVPSATMTCLEWWSYEVLILLSGLLPNPKVETSVLSICFSISYLHYFIPYGIGATASTRVSNELGAGNPEAAKMAVRATMVVATAEVIVISTILFLFRHSLGHAFSNDKEIVRLVADMAPFLCLSMIMDSFQAVLSGVVRGSGWQRVGAYVNLGAYYLIGTPAGAVLAFVAHLRVKGLLIGLATGTGVQATLLGLTIIFTDWQKQAELARERIFEGNPQI